MEEECWALLKEGEEEKLVELRVALNDVLVLFSFASDIV